jgi:hypothetical protein
MSPTQAHAKSYTTQDIRSFIIQESIKSNVYQDRDNSLCGNHIHSMPSRSSSNNIFDEKNEETHHEKNVEARLQSAAVERSLPIIPKRSTFDLPIIPISKSPFPNFSSFEPRSS